MISATDLENRMVSLAVAGPLGQPATYTPSGGGATSIRAVLRLDAMEAISESGAPMRTRRAEVTVDAASLDAAPARGDAITIGGSDWRVADVQRDGQSAYVLTIRDAG